MGIRALFANFGLDLTGQAADLRRRARCWPATSSGSSSRWPRRGCPARRTDADRARPGAARRHRPARVVDPPPAAAGAGGASSWAPPRWAAGLFTDIPRGGWVLGLGILVVLLGVTAVSPVISRPFLAAAQAAYRRVFGSVGNLAGQNSLRNPRRTTATASALMIGLALACTMAILGDSAKASVDQAIEENFVGDYVVSSVFGEPFSPSIATEMAQVDGIDRVVRQRWAQAERDGDFFGIAGIDPADTDFLGITMLRGTLADFTDGSMLVDEGWAEDEGLVGRRHLHAGQDAEGQARAAGGRHLRREPGHLLPDGHHAGDAEGPGVPDLRQRPDPRRRRATPSACRPGSTRSSRTCRSSPSRTRRPSPTSSARPSTSWC